MFELCASPASSLTNFTTRSISSGVMKQPCTRVGLASPSGKYSMSPLPTSFSAPVVSRMMRDSREEATAKAMRLGMFAFIRPVMTSAEGPHSG